MSFILCWLYFYAGQTLLHIAVVKQDISLVHFLLGNGADVNCQATGTFFTPLADYEGYVTLPERTEVFDFFFEIVCLDTRIRRRAYVNVVYSL